jgi:seryl-tRNA synthetase
MPPPPIALYSAGQSLGDRRVEDAQLRDAFLKLREELEKLGPQDEAARARLNGLLVDIERRLADPEAGADDDSLIANIKDSVEQFEVEHPRATAILNDIMLALSNMGI